MFETFLNNLLTNKFNSIAYQWSIENKVQFIKSYVKIVLDEHIN